MIYLLTFKLYILIKRIRQIKTLIFRLRFAKKKFYLKESYNEKPNSYIHFTYKISNSVFVLLLRKKFLFLTLKFQSKHQCNNFYLMVLI